MGDAQSAQRDGTSEATAEEQNAVQDGPSGDSTHDELVQNNGQISDINGKSDETITEVNDHCEDKVSHEAITVEGKVTSVTKSEPQEVTNVQIIQETLSDANEEEPIEIINVDTKQNDLNESFRKFFSNIGLKLTVKTGAADQADDEGEKEVEKLDIVEETASETKYEDVEQNTDLHVIQDNDSTTCPTLTDETPEDVFETGEGIMTETNEIAVNVTVQEANVSVNEHDGNQNQDATLDESPHKQEGEEFASPIKKFFSTGIFAGLAKKKKEEEALDKELVDISKKKTAIEEQQEIGEISPNVAKQEEIGCKDVHAEEVQKMAAPEENVRGKSPSTDQDSESEITSSQEKTQSSPFKRLFSGSFKRRSKRQKRRKSSDAKLSDSGEHIENEIVVSNEKTEQVKAEESPSPVPPPTTEPEEELSAWEAFKKLMTPRKSLKRASEEIQVPAATVEETKPSEGERVSDQSIEEGRKRKDSSHSWEAVLCGSGRRRSRKTSDSEDEQKEDRGQVESPNEAGDVLISTPKQTESPSDSESSTWKSFKKLMTPKRKVKEDEESKDAAQSDSEATQEETLFSLRKLLPGRKKKQDQLSSDEGDREMVSEDENSETPAVVPLSEFAQSETEESAKTDTEIEESKLESEQEHILEIPKTFVQEVQEHQVTPVVSLNQDQDELTEFSKYQPLSDIPEEGHITETVATSLMEEVAKDDTIAEDMVEITSEAITAPEPVDITMADETDELMLSAASHLPESSKTSGNATPVPAEYDIKDTDVLLKEVVETISTAATAETVCSEESVLERVVSSVTQETLGRAVSKEQDVMLMHAQSEAVITETELQVNQMQDTATARSESLSEFKDAFSTEYVSEVSKLEFESAKADVDEIHLTHPKRPVKQESVDDSEYMIESLSEVPESTKTVLQDYMVQDIVPAECLDGETKETRTESRELLLDEKVEAINLLEKERAEIQDPTPTGPELPKAEEDSVLKICKEELAVQEDETVDSIVLFDQPGELVQPSEERIDVQSLEGDAELGKEETQELSNGQTPEQLQEETESCAEVEIVAEDFEYINKQEVEQEQDSALETQSPPVQELAVQEEQCLLSSGLAIKEEIIEDEVTEQPEQGIIGELDQDIVEGHIFEFNEAIMNNVKLPLTEAITEQESGVDNVKEPVTEEQEGGVNNVRVPLTEATTEQEGGLDKVKESVTEATTGQEGGVDNVKEPVTEATTEQDGGYDNVKEPVTEATTEQDGGYDNVKEPVTEATTEQDGRDDNVKEPVTEATTEQDGGDGNLKAPVIEATTEQEGGLDKVKESVTEATTGQEGGVDNMKEPVTEATTEQDGGYDTVKEPVTEATTEQDGGYDNVKEPVTEATTEQDGGVDNVKVPLTEAATEQEGGVNNVKEPVTEVTAEQEGGLDNVKVPLTEATTKQDGGDDNVKEPVTEATPEQEGGLDNVKEPVIVATTEQEGGLDNIKESVTEATTGQEGGVDNVKEPVIEATTEQNGGDDNVKEPVTEATTGQEGGVDNVKEPVIEATTEQNGGDDNVKEPVTEATTEQEGGQLKVDGFVISGEVVATEGTVLLADEKIQKTEAIAREVALRDGSGELEEQPLPEATSGDIYDKIEVQETTEDQEQEMLPEEPGVQNGQVIASSAKEHKVVFKLDHALEISGEHTEAAQVMCLDHRHEVTEDLEALLAVHLSSINEDSGIAQVLEDTVDLEKSSELIVSTTEEPIHAVHIGETEVKVEVQLEEEIPCPMTELAKVVHATLPEESMAASQQVTTTMPDLILIQRTVEESERISEETSIPFVDNAEILDEPKNEIHLIQVEEVGIQGEKEEEIIPPLTSNADMQYTFVAQMATCSFSDVATRIPEVSLKTTKQIYEPMVGKVTSEQEHNEPIETTTPLVAQQGKTVVLMHVPLVKLEDKHQIQVQVVDLDIQSAETSLDTALEIVVQEDKKVVYTCHETVERVDSVSATSEIEQEMVSEKDNVAIQDVVQHVKAPDSEEEPEHKEPPSDLVDEKLSEDHKIIETNNEEDAVAVIQEVMATKDEVLTKMGKEFKEVQKAPTVENQVAIPSSTAGAVPKNTGIVSSSGIVEAPSSLSLEFKLNIQFGQSRAPILPSPPSTIEKNISCSPSTQSPTVPPVVRSESPKSTEMTEVGVQAVDEESNQKNEGQKTDIITAEAAVQATTEEPDLVETVGQVLMGVAIQSTEIKEQIEDVKATEITQKKTILMDVGTQSTEIAEQAEEKTTEMETIDSQPVLINVAVQSMQQEELSEKDKIKVECPSIQPAEIVQPDKELTKEEVVLTEMIVLQVSGDPIKQIEDEDENQDVWMDAEEDIDGQEERTMTLCEIEDSFESQPDYFEETKSDFEESFSNIKKTTLKCDSEEEDFAAALEDPQIATTISTIEWD